MRSVTKLGLYVMLKLIFHKAVTRERGVGEQSGPHHVIRKVEICQNPWWCQITPRTRPLDRWSKSARASAYGAEVSSF